MNNIEIEKKLVEEGFTAKEMAILKERVELDSTTYQSLLVDLSKRFIAGIVILAIVYIFYGAGYFFRDDESLTVLVIMFAFVFAVVWFLAPLKLGAKAYFFRKRNPYL